MVLRSQSLLTHSRFIAKMRAMMILQIFIRCSAKGHRGKNPLRRMHFNATELAKIDAGPERKVKCAVCQREYGRRRRARVRGNVPALPNGFAFRHGNNALVLGNTFSEGRATVNREDDSAFYRPRSGRR